MNEVVGAQIVSVPMTVPVQKALDAFYVFMGTVFIVFVVIVIALNVLLNMVVVKPVKQMAEIAQQVSTGDLRADSFNDAGNDEIATLAGSFNRMRRSLEKAMRMLDA